MNQKRKTPFRESGHKEKSARPEHLQKAIVQERARKRRSFRLKPQVKIGGIIILVLLLVFSGSMIFCPVKRLAVEMQGKYYLPKQKRQK